MPTVAFLTVGCKLNQYESQALADIFTREGYTVIPSDQPADVYVINTCAVTAKSDATSRKMIRRAIRTNPQAKVVAVGCSTQIDPKQFSRIEGVDLVLGSGNKTDILKHLPAAETGTVVLPKNDTCNFDAFDIDGYQHKSRAFIKIQEGCDHFCTYCVIPYARGRLKSRPLAGVTAQVTKLLAHGHREIVVCGTHLGLYGCDLENGNTLQEAVQTLCALQGKSRFRISSLEPMDITNELISFIANQPKVCRHLHLPVQGAEDTILKRMNRPYTIAEYGDLLQRLISQIPDICLGADIITAFPGETDAQHQAAYAALEQLPLAYFHVFPFSPRPGTPAADYPDQVPYHTARARVHDLLALRQKKIHHFHQRTLGTTLSVLIESTRDATTGKLVGMSDTYVRILLDGPDTLMNQLCNAIPDTYTNGYLTGTITGDPQ